MGSDVLRVGFPPADESSPRRADTAELARVLGQRLGAEITAVHAPDYRELVEDLVAGTLDVAWLPPLGLLRSERRVRPVLTVARAGKASYHGALIARRDAGMVGVADLAGKRVGWVDADSAAGHVLARALIAEVHPNVDAFLGEQRMLGSHRAVVEAVHAGDVDAGGTFLNFSRDGKIVLSGWQEFLGPRADDIVPIAITGSIPADVIAVRWELPRETTDALVGGLRALAGDPETRSLIARVFNGAESFDDPRPDAYEPLAEVARRAGWKP